MIWLYAILGLPHPASHLLLLLLRSTLHHCTHAAERFLFDSFSLNAIFSAPILFYSAPPPPLVFYLLNFTHSSSLCPHVTEKANAQMSSISSTQTKRGREKEKEGGGKESLITRKCWRGSVAPVRQPCSSWHTRTHARARRLAVTHWLTHTHTPEGARPWGCYQ